MYGLIWVYLSFDQKVILGIGVILGTGVILEFLVVLGVSVILGVSIILGLSVMLGVSIILGVLVQIFRQETPAGSRLDRAYLIKELNGTPV